MKTAKPLLIAFLAFGDETHPFAAPDVSYGFYPVYAAINGVQLHRIPLKADFSVDYRDYCGINETVLIDVTNIICIKVSINRFLVDVTSHNHRARQMNFTYPICIRIIDTNLHARQGLTYRFSFMRILQYREGHTLTKGFRHAVGLIDRQRFLFTSFDESHRNEFSTEQYNT